MSLNCQVFNVEVKYGGNRGTSIIGLVLFTSRPHDFIFPSSLCTQFRLKCVKKDRSSR